MKLNRSLASEQQLAELISGKDMPISGHGTKEILREAPRLVAEYGGNPNDWSKVASRSYQTINSVDKTQFEIHAYWNKITGQLVEEKTIIKR
ncbi:hypothetical protein [Mycoavidus sp. SF9855]|uniref:hypothetical protein n=1 Tax=Mycoavidus sp. SF9855 TaxID=2968475 RepID=UPI00211CCCE7|nr:hypothetical protein [Mycoavidus sp. SF9855]UUM22181.1 hypothetical protein NQD60_03625 [Mycoavidus sp. SF9855]